MKIVCEREKLLASFQTAALAVPSRSPKEILTNVKLDVGEEAVLSATDMEFSVRLTVPGVEIARKGAAILPVAHFNSILRESNDDHLSIETTDRGYIVKGDRSQFKLPSIDPEEFPVIPAFREEKYHLVAAPLFREMITRTEFATDTESSRFALGGVLLEMEGDRMIAVGTDGRRLAKMEGPAEAVGGHSTADTQTIVRTPSVRLLARAMNDSEEPVRIAARGNDVVIKTSRATFMSRLVEGRFPRWRDVFPRRTEAIRMDLSVGPFFSAVRQAAIVAGNEFKGVDFDFGSGTLVVSAVSPQYGESRIELPIPYDGPVVGVTLDHKFVTDFLKVLKPETQFNLEIESSDSAALFTTEDGYSYVVMPLARSRPSEE